MYGQSSFRIPMLAALCLYPFLTSLAQTPPTLVRKITTEGVIFSSPAVDATGNVYVGSNDHSLHALRPDGTTKWTFQTGDWVDSTPAISEDGIIYVGSWDNKLHAINSSTGSRLWTYPTNSHVTASPAIGSNGLIHFGSHDTVFYALNSDGSLAWEYFAGNPIFASAAIGTDGTIYFGDEGGVFHAIHPDGTEKWTYATEEVTDFNNSILSSPAIDENGNLYFGCGNGYCYSLADHGTNATLNWKYLTGDRVDSSPVLGLNDEVFFAGRDGYLRALSTYSATTENIPTWEELVGDVFYSSPVVDEEGRVYIIAYAGSGKNRLYCYIATGTMQWSNESIIGGVVDSSPVLTADNKLYFGCHDKALYCLDLGSGPADDSPWPTFHRSPMRDGALPSYTIYVSVSPEGAGQINGTGTYPKGSNVSLNAVANLHYQFSNWHEGSSQASNSNPYSFTLNENKEFTANFVQTFSLSVSAGQGGRVTPTEAQTHASGTLASITAIPDTGYSFVSWTGIGVTQTDSASTTVSMTANREISATFALDSYQLTITASSGGSITGEGNYTYNQEAPILATPDDGYTFSGWEGPGISNSSDASTSVHMTEDRNISASFTIKNYVLALNAGNGGSVSQGGDHDHGALAPITATPLTGYSFHQWTGDGVQNKNAATTSVLMTQPRSVSASFSINLYDLNVSSETGGRVEGSGTHEHGTYADIKAIPDEGYVFDGWNGTGITDSSQQSTSILMDQNHSITANFRIRDPEKFLLSISESPEAGGASQGSDEYGSGSLVTILAIPHTGYSFISWSGPGITDFSEANTTVLVEQDVNITANFSLNSHELTISTSAGGSATGQGSHSYRTQAEIIATPSTGYSFSHWNGDGISDPNSPSTTVDMTMDRSISAIFSINFHKLSISSQIGGSVSNGGDFEYNSEAGISATPLQGYYFTGWTGTGISSSSEANTSVLMNEDRSVTANFSKIALHLGVTSMEGGSVTSGGTFDYGSTITILAEALDGYAFSHWDGDAVADPKSAQTFILLEKNSSVVAVFERKTGQWVESWLGFLIQANDDWVYLYPMRWMYSPTKKTLHDYWLWHPDLHWLWVEANTFNGSYLWMASSESWIYHDSSDSGNPKYFNYRTGNWVKY